MPPATRRLPDELYNALYEALQRDRGDVLMRAVGLEVDMQSHKRKLNHAIRLGIAEALDRYAVDELKHLLAEQVAVAEGEVRRRQNEAARLEANRIAKAEKRARKKRKEA